MTSVLDKGLTVISDMVCQTVPDFSGFTRLTRGITVIILHVMEWNVCLALLWPQQDTNRINLNPATLSTPVSLFSLSSWMNARAPATQRMTEWRPLIYYQPMKYRICLPWNGFFGGLLCTCEETCVSVWPPNAIIYLLSSTCSYLRPLGSPFGQGFMVKNRTIDNCKSKVFPDQYYLIISWAQALSLSRSHVFF